MLLSGGDSLMVSDETLEYIIKRVRAIPHVEIVRLGSRTPVVCPQRITPELCAMLKKYHPVWLNTHFNTPKEFTPEAAKACAMLADAGIPLGNQSVLLAGVNDCSHVMMELVQGEGGVLPLDRDYVKAVARLCAEKDWLLLVDEVQTGVGRTGSLFAFQQYGILPDVASFAKGIAGGLPMSGILANEKCRDVLGPGTHATTFGANPVCAAAGLVVQAVTRNGASTLSADQYTLSPTLLETVGQQAITVTFGQLTTTFEVTVREDIVTLGDHAGGWHHPSATPA